MTVVYRIVARIVAVTVSVTAKTTYVLLFSLSIYYVSRSRQVKSSNPILMS